MTRHTHTYHLPSVSMLTLPDRGGYYDAVLVWHCVVPGCAHACYATGMVNQHSRNLTVPHWEAALARERHLGTLESRLAAREEAYHASRR